jgi:mercuric ion transport protein
MVVLALSGSVASMTCIGWQATAAARMDCCQAAHDGCADQLSADACCAQTEQVRQQLFEGLATFPVSLAPVTAAPASIIQYSRCAAAIAFERALHRYPHSPPFLGAVLLIWSIRLALRKRSITGEVSDERMWGTMQTERVSSVFGLASSITTLVCWAFPILFVTLGLGSVVASAVTVAPWLAVIGRHKTLVFVASGLLLAANYWLVVVRPRRCAPGELCHIDSPVMRWNRRVFWLSAVIYICAVGLTYGSVLVLSAM